MTEKNKKESKKQQWWKVTFYRKEKWVCYIPAESEAAAIEAFNNRNYDLSTEDYVDDDNNTRTVRRESVVAVDGPERPKRYRDYEAFLNKKNS